MGNILAQSATFANTTHTLANCSKTLSSLYPHPLGDLSHFIIKEASKLSTFISYSFDCNKPTSSTNMKLLVSIILVIREVFYLDSSFSYLKFRLLLLLSLPSWLLNLRLNLNSMAMEVMALGLTLMEVMVPTLTDSATAATTMATTDTTNDMATTDCTNVRLRLKARPTANLLLNPKLRLNLKANTTDIILMV